MKNKYFISTELKDLVTHISCHFVDAKTTSKENVMSLKAKSPANAFGEQGFNISTCLRFENYSFKFGLKSNDLFYVERSLCIRRLLSIMVGLQSEIIGEKEIIIQISSCIYKAYKAGRLPLHFLKGCQNLIELAQKIRIDYDIETKENYSTVGAHIISQHLKSLENPTLLIVGAGYMMQSFAKSFDTNINKIIGGNRTPKKLTDIIKDYPNFKNIPRKVVKLDEVVNHTTKANAVFAAMDARATPILEASFSKDCLIIDVSYPPYFQNINVGRHMDLTNTFFSEYIQKKPQKENIELALKKIDEIIHEIEK